MSEFGVFSEVGRLRKVMVHRPELSLRRLTPSNKDELLFDDVLWVDRAQQQHDDFVALMRQEGVQVLYHQDLLAEALAQPGARESAVGRAVSALTVGPSMVQDVRQRLLADSPEELAAHLIGGLTKAEVEGIDLEAAERRSPSTPCSGRPGAWKSTTSAPSTTITPCSGTRGSPTGTPRGARTGPTTPRTSGWPP